MGGRDDRPSAVADIQSSGQLRWDLREGLSRQDVGLPDGQRTQMFGPGPGNPPIDAEVVVADDLTIAYDVDSVSVEFDGTGASAEPRFVVLGRTFPTVEAAADELERAVAMVGIDEDEVRTWLASALRERGKDDPAAFRPFVFRAPDRGAVTLEVEAAMTLPDGRVTVSYLLNL